MTPESDLLKASEGPLTEKASPGQPFLNPVLEVSLQLVRERQDPGQ